MSVEEYLKDLTTAMTEVKKVVAALGGDSNYKIERVLESYTALFDRSCPHKVGDRVEMSETPVINEHKRWGWSSAKHYLIEGSPGVVVGRDFYKGSFRFDVEMDLESYIPTWNNEEGNWKKSSSRHTYCLNESQLRPSVKEEWLIFRSESMAPKWVSELIGDKI